MQVIVEQTRTSMFINALLLILIGALFIIDENLALSIGFIIAGIFLFISGLVPMLMYRTADVMGIIMVVLGVLLIVIPSVFADITFIIIGVIAIVVGALALVGACYNTTTAGRLIGILIGAFIIIAGIMVLTRMDIAFIVFGALLVIAGALNIVGAMKKEPA
jgi:uncharacterized membrane protein HdeD (DUF308 family)